MKRGISRSSLKHRHGYTSVAGDSVFSAICTISRTSVSFAFSYCIHPHPTEPSWKESFRKKSVHVQNSIYPALCVCVFFFSIFFLPSFNRWKFERFDWNFFRFVSSWYLICKCRSFFLNVSKIKVQKSKVEKLEVEFRKNDIYYGSF